MSFAVAPTRSVQAQARMGAKPAPAVPRTAVRSSASRSSSVVSSSSSFCAAPTFQASALAASRPSARRVARAVRVQAANKPDNKGKKVAIITGASSGLGLNAAKALTQQGWYVVMACRDYLKAARAAQAQGMPENTYTIMHLDLSALDSVRQFIDLFRASGLPLDALVCNAAVYLPTAETPTFTADGFELSVGTNHLGHFLLANTLLDDLKRQAKASGSAPRLVIVGSVTGNTNTLAGNIPPKADLGDLRGLEGPQTSVMIDGGEFNGAKAYKDSKVCNMLTMREMHRRFHDQTGIAFSSLYPGCIAETGLFRNHVPLFRTLFPPFQKYITKGYVSEVDAGKRLAQVVSDPKMSKSGVYWSWNDNANSFENTLSEEAGDDAKAAKLWELSEKLVGLKTAGKSLVAA